VSDSFAEITQRTKKLRVRSASWPRWLCLAALPFLLASPTNDPPIKNDEHDRRRKQIVQHAEIPILEDQKPKATKRDAATVKM
jgi:hypothetical protein